MALLALLAASASVAFGSKIETLSFEAPFEEVNANGERVVGKSWRASGSAAVHSNFVRLTPDRQSKKGAVWASTSVGVSELSATLKFRISGQGKKYFGDGMALWLTDSRSYRAGDFHGSTEKFKGMGIIFDTFKNAELLSLHKDVTIVVNEGKGDVEQMLADARGCAGNIRYHEDRGDFSVASASRAKLVITPDDPGAGNASPLSLVVQLDEANGGAFADCAAFSLPPALNAGWLSRAYLGVSASTGQLADNHDVLELEAFSSQTAHVEAEAAEAEEKYFEPGEGVSPERFDRIETQLDALVAQLEHLQHHLEHEMVAVDDHVRATIDKLAKQEEASEQRIDALEAKVVSNVEDSLTQRIATLEQAMRDAVQKRISTVENRYMSKLGDVVSDKIDNAGRGWTWPFLFLIVVDVIAFVLVRNWYVKFKKSHLL